MAATDLSNVYDLFFPSPPSLKELASLEIAMNLWRREIQQNLIEEGTLRERRKKASLRCLLKDLRLPPTTLPTIEKYVIEFGKNIPSWLYEHSELDILKFDLEFEVLKHFWDFAYDFDGDIHCGRTAKRFVACERNSNDVKFRMACFYCLEDDIFRIWPEVSSHMTINEIDLDFDSKLYYWVCRLKNQLHEIQAMLTNNITCIEEFILHYATDDYNEGDWPSQEYFLNRLPSNTAMEYMALIGHLVDIWEDLDYHNLENVFFRHILVKLNETELKKFLNEKGDVFISLSPRSFVLNIWAYIKNKITSDVFCRLIKRILNKQTNNPSKKDDTSYLCELWISAPDHLKQAAIRDVLLIVDNSYFHRNYSSNNLVGARRSVSFLFAMLSDMQVEDRKKFWYKHWNTIPSHTRPNDFRDLINLCFDNDSNQANRFKEDVMYKNHQRIHRQLKKLLKEGCFKELEEFLMFWYSNEQTIKEVRLKLLHDNFTISTKLIGEASSLNKFIDSAYEDKALAIEFKNKVLVVPDLKAVKIIKSVISRGCYFCHVSEFIDTFAPSDEIAAQIKKRDIEPIFKPVRQPYFDEFVKFVSWLYESDEEISQFKLSWDVAALVEEAIKDKTELVRCKNSMFDWFNNCFQTEETSDLLIKKFLNWFFVSPDALEAYINEQYAHDQISYEMLKRLLL